MTRPTALLVVDRRFVEVDGDVYTEGPVGAETGGRYLEWFDRVIVAGRKGAPAGRTVQGLSRVSAPGLQVDYLPDISGLARRFRSAANARRQLESLFSQVDCVIARLPSELGVEAASLALQRGKPLALDVGGCVLDGMRTHGSLAGRLYAPVAYRRMRDVAGRAAWVSYVTQQFLQQRYPSAPGSRTVACSNVDIPEPARDVLDTRLRRIDADARPLTFGTIGSLYGEFKGIQHALPALARAAPGLPPFRYRVLGGGDVGPWQQRAERHGLADRVTFDDVLPAGEAVLQWLDGIDVYLQPSLREGLPRALIEAMSRGCPAIASDIAGIPELLPADCLHAPGDVDRLVRLITDSVPVETRRSRATSNWERAGQYSGNRLRALRNDFWSAFRDSVRARP